MYHHRLWKDACRLSACCDAPRDRRSVVRQRRHWCSHCCACCPACCCTRRSNFPCCDTVVFTHLVLIAIFLVAIFHVCFAVLEV